MEGDCITVVATNKQVSKVMGKISEAGTTVFIMSLARTSGPDDELRVSNHRPTARNIQMYPV